MTEHDTPILAARLHRLADEITPPLDVVAQVRTARDGHRRQRRGRIALLAVATATTAVVVGTSTAVQVLSAGDTGEVARQTSLDTSTPSAPIPPTPSAPIPPTPSAPPPVEPPSPPSDWEARTFEDVSFSVPPGARMPDTVAPGPVTSWMDGPALTWNGPLIGGDVHSYVTVRLTETFEGGLIPTDGGEWRTVPGTERAYGAIDAAADVDGDGNEVRTTEVWLDALDGDRLVRVTARFPGGDVGRQMGERLLASLSSAWTGDLPEPTPWVPSTEWASKTVQDITFSVPPGSSAPEHRTDSTLIWYGPEVAGTPTSLALSVLPLRPGQSVGDGYSQTTVPGADQAWVKTDLGTINPDHATFDVRIHDSGRDITVGGTLPLGPGVEQTMQRVIASIVVG